MKRSYYLIGILTAMILISSLLYYRYASETYILISEDFSKDDILIKEEYPMHDESASVFLLANSEKIGLIVPMKNKWGLWRSKLKSIANKSADKQLVTVGFARTTEETIDIESHMMIAYYVDHPFDVESPAEYDLTVEFIPVNDRTLLFAHAVSNGNSSLSSVEIVSYLENYYK